MSLLQVEHSEVSGGMSKMIDEGALPLIFDNLQKSQYNYPIPSTIREIVCNAADSIKEAEIARKIIQDNEPVEKYYIKKEGSLYKDSYFNRDYYDLDHLSTDPLIYIEYIEGKQGDKDTIVITDHGVGLGGNRMLGYFKLGYSTKRLSTSEIGKYGIGAKAPLSTNIPFYTVESCYNGKLYRFNIYSYKVEPTIPPFNMLTAIPNIKEVFTGYDGEELVIYSEPTNKPNGVSIIIPAKKHHKDSYINAVKTQLLYFSNILFFVQNEHGKRDRIETKADIVYEDDYIVLSNSNVYNKPHIVINRVNYGYIDFKELELEDKMGNIGVKVSPQEVDVTPSRESIQWTETTRDTLIEKFKNVVNIAQSIINKSLIETDFLKWLQTCASLKRTLHARRGEDIGNSVISRLAGVADLDSVVLSYNPRPSIKFSNELFKDRFLVRFVSWETHRKVGIDTKTVARKTLPYSTMFSAEYPIYVHSGRADNRKDQYMLDTMHKDGFILIQLNTIDADEDIIIDPIAKDDLIDFLRDKIKESSLARSYESIVVPEHVKEKVVKPEDDEIVQVEQTRKLRALDKSELSFTTPSFITGQYTYPHMDNTHRGIPYRMIRGGVSKSALNEWETEEVFYGYQEDKELLFIIALITSPVKNYYIQDYSGSWIGREFNNNGDTETYRDMVYLNLLHDNKDNLSSQGFIEPAYNTLPLHMYYNNSVRLLQVSQSAYKYVKDFRHATNFFKDVRKNTITMSSSLIRWNTARIINSYLNKIGFLNNFDQLDSEKAARYAELKTYRDTYYRAIETVIKSDSYDAIVEHCDKIMELQLFVQNNPDAEVEAIGKLAKGLFGQVVNRFDTPIEINNGCAVDINIYNNLMSLVEWSEPVSTLFSEIPALTHTKKSLSQELEMCLREYATFKNLAL